MYLQNTNSPVSDSQVYDQCLFATDPLSNWGKYYYVPIAIQLTPENCSKCAGVEPFQFKTLY